MPGSTAGGYPYALPGDPLTGWPAVSQSLAMKVDGLGKWQAWTPTITGTASPNVAARYTRIGDTVHFVARAVLTAGVTGELKITLPVPKAAGYPAEGVNTFCYFSVSGSRYPGHAFLGSETELFLRRIDPATGVSGPVTASLPGPWAANDRIIIAGTYEAA
jgi:hypothetical protein